MSFPRLLKASSLHQYPAIFRGLVGIRAATPNCAYNLRRWNSDIAVGKSNNTTDITAKLSNNVTKKQSSHMSDEEVDGWLESIKELREEFAQTPFIPEQSLVNPGQGQVDLMDEVIKEANKFDPTPEQTQEWEALKEVPLPQRYDPILQHVTNMIMRHGKKQKAERLLSRALYLLFCNARKDPIEILKKSLDDLAPLMVVKTFSTGVAKKSVVPIPLSERQRHRIAWKWIVESANKRVSSDFAVRLGEELIAVYKGKSSAYEKRDQMHKAAIANRAYITLK